MIMKIWINYDPCTILGSISLSVITNTRYAIRLKNNRNVNDIVNFKFKIINLSFT